MKPIYDSGKGGVAGSYERFWTANEVMANHERAKGDESLEEILAYLEAAKQSAILDVGCGMGRVSEYLANRGFRVIGLDVALSGLKAYRGVRPGAALVCGSVSAQPFRPKCFDIVLIMGVLYELESSQEITTALKQVRELLCEGGRVIYVSQYPKDLWKTLLSYVPYRNRWFRRYVLRERDQRDLYLSGWVISNAETVALFAASGFDIEVVKPLNLYYGVASWFKDLFYRRPQGSRSISFEADRNPEKYVRWPGRLIVRIARSVRPMLCAGLVLFRSAPVHSPKQIER